MNFSGMKVLSIDPGHVHWDPANKSWYYTIRVNGRTYYGVGFYATEKTAKQQMREKVRLLRKKHMIGGDT